MKPADNINNLFENSKITVGSEVDQKILNKALGALPPKAASPDRTIWSIIMKSNITKFSTAAVVIIAVFIGMRMLNGTAAWAEAVQKLELSYNRYHKDLLLAVEEKNLQSASSNADALSELWQGIRLLAEAKIDPSLSLDSKDSLGAIKLIFGKTTFDDIDQHAFQDYADGFLNWLNKIEDTAWIHEAIHISKEMEEYAEEIRDAETDAGLGLSYAEHCLTGFMTYSNWFEQLPWDNPKENMSPVVILEAIERDLTIAFREIETTRRRDADRVSKRCIEQAVKNSIALEQRTQTSNTANQWKLAHKLNKKTNQLSDLIAYLIIAAGDIGVNNKIHKPESIREILNTEFADKDSFSNYLIEEISQTLELCNRLHDELESMH